MQRCDKVLITTYKMHRRRHQERTIRMGWVDLKEHRTEILECWIDPERERGWPLDISEEVGHAGEDASRGRGFSKVAAKMVKLPHESTWTAFSAGFARRLFLFTWLWMFESPIKVKIGDISAFFYVFKFKVAFQISNGSAIVCRRGDRVVLLFLRLRGY